VEYWNVSWWVAWAFTLGSVVWVINGFAGYLPYGDSKHFEKAQESPGWTAFIGATIFELGSILGMWEAWNRGDAAHFGYECREAASEMERALGFKTKDIKPDPEEADMEKNGASGKDMHKIPHKKWIWFSTDTKYFHELGFLAAFWQLIAASIFWISGFTAIPTINTAIENNVGLLDGIFWTPQVVGGTGFMISAACIMLESQKKWYKPEFTSLGWHVGLWNEVGAIGFMLCGALGYAPTTNTKAYYQSALSTFWGGWAFLIGSVIQLYEAVNPIEQ